MNNQEAVWWLAFIVVFLASIALDDYLRFREVSQATENGYEQCLVGREKLWKKRCDT